MTQVIVRKPIRCIFCNRILAYEMNNKLEIFTKNSQTMVIEGQYWEGYCKCGVVITVSGMLLHYDLKGDIL